MYEWFVGFISHTTAMSTCVFSRTIEHTHPLSDTIYSNTHTRARAHTYVQTVDTVSDRTWIWIPTNMAARNIAEITNTENARLSATLLNQQEISVWHALIPRLAFFST